jgi:hypothetical protein
VLSPIAVTATGQVIMYTVAAHEQLLLEWRPRPLRIGISIRRGRYKYWATAGSGGSQVMPAEMSSRGSVPTGRALGLGRGLPLRLLVRPANYEGGRTQPDDGLDPSELLGAPPSQRRLDDGLRAHGRSSCPGCDWSLSTAQGPEVSSSPWLS